MKAGAPRLLWLLKKGQEFKKNTGPTVKCPSTNSGMISEVGLHWVGIRDCWRGFLTKAPWREAFKEWKCLKLICLGPLLGGTNFLHLPSFGLLCPLTVMLDKKDWFWFLEEILEIDFFALQLLKKWSPSCGLGESFNGSIIAFWTPAQPNTFKPRLLATASGMQHLLALGLW